MPGFMINGKGKGPDGGMEVYRVYRWKLTELIRGTMSLPTEFMGTELDFKLPELSFETMNIPGMSADYNIPKKPKFQDITMNFYDTRGLYKYFNSWQHSIWDPQTGMFNGRVESVGSGVRGIVQCVLLDHNGEVEETFRIFNAWPKTISHSQLSMSTDNLKTVTITFTYDYFLHKCEKIAGREEMLRNTEQFPGQIREQLSNVVSFVATIPSVPPPVVPPRYNLGAVGGLITQLIDAKQTLTYAAAHARLMGTKWVQEYTNTLINSFESVVPGSASKLLHSGKQLVNQKIQNIIN